MDPVNYVDWYGLPANDAYNGNYEDVIGLFSGDNAAPAPAALLTTISTGADGKIALALLGDDGLIYVAHRFLRFRAMAGVQHAQNDQVFATLGDVNRVGVDTILFPSAFLYRTANLPSVRTADSIDAEILAQPDEAQLAIVNPPDPPEEFAAALVRLTVMIPPHLVGHVLAATRAPGGLSPRGLWTQIARPLIDDAVTGPMCTPFTDWCRVAYSNGVTAANPLAVAIPGNFRLNDLALETSRWTVLNSDLPARAVPPPVAPINLDGVVAQIGGLRADAAQRAAVTDQRAAQKAAAALLPSKRWTASVSRILSLCQVDDENELPDVWHEMAKASIKMDVTTIQTFLDRDMPELGTSGRTFARATCSSELAKKLGSLNFQSDDSSDLEAALSIFSVSYPTQASVAATSAAAGQYSQMVQGAAGISFQDSIKISEAQRFSLPVNLMQVKRVCWAYHRLLAVILGVHHTVTAAFGRFVEALDARESVLSEDFSNVYNCASLLRFVQLRMHMWARDQMTDPLNHQAAPDFAGVFREIDEQRWVMPTLPLRFLQVSAPTVAPATTAPIAAPTPPPAGAAPLAGAFHVKPALLDKERVPIQKYFATKRHMDAHGPTPRNAQGNAMCLLFHVRAACKHECPRAEDHYRHSPAESQRLADYLALATAVAPAPAV